MRTNFEIENRLVGVKEYLTRVLGMSLETELAEEHSRANLLPIYLDRSYQFYYARIHQQTLTLAFPLEADMVTPARMKKDSVAIANVLKFPVVFVMESLPSHQRTRLIQDKVAFIIPGKQLHIPFMLLSLTDKEEKYRAPKLEKLRPASQVLLLYHLTRERLDNYNYQTIAQRIGYSAMTVKRAVDELVHYRLAYKQGNYEKFIRFVAQQKELWEQALQYLSSPVKFSDHISELPDSIRLKKANLSALNVYTDLAPGPKPKYALFENYRMEFRKQVKPYEIDYFGITDFGTDDPWSGTIEIEVWAYDPAILSQTDTVDPLSLYLSMPSYITDERLLIAKEELINNHVW